MIVSGGNHDDPVARLRDVSPELRALADHYKKVDDARAFLLVELVHDAVEHGDTLREKNREDARVALDDVIERYRREVTDAAWHAAFEPKCVSSSFPRID